ncbi:MAG: erythromycin esterase family protein [Planctomycetes bacterium]|nr:erythromycin esterase family protein [Planctomycetota bacterium]
MFRRMLISLIALALSALALSGGSSASPVAATSQDDKERDEAVIGWLRKGARTLRGIQPGAADNNDLNPLQKILEGVRVVGIGEATHGTREFVQVRHCFLEFLVKELGFTALAMEFSVADGNVINEYVVHGRGSRRQVIACLKKGWITDTEELLAVFDWLRAHNASVAEGRRVKFFGLDPQGNARAIEVVRDFLRRTAPQRLAKVEALLETMNEQDRNALEFAPTAVTAEKVDQLYRLISYLVLHREDLIRHSSALEWDRALEHLKLLAQFAEFNSSAPFNGAGTRDGYMAENLLAALRREALSTRIVVWAHNAHVCTRESGRFPALGGYLHKAFGKEYYAFGVAFEHGEFRAQLPKVRPPKLATFKLGAASAGTIDYMLSKVGIANFMVDLRAPAADERVSAWLKAPHNLHWVGAFFMEEWASKSATRPFVLNRDFDGLVFIEKSTPTRAIPAPLD